MLNIPSILNLLQYIDMFIRAVLLAKTFLFIQAKEFYVFRSVYLFNQWLESLKKYKFSHINEWIMWGN